MPRRPSLHRKYQKVVNRVSYIEDKLLLIDAQLKHLDPASPIVQRIQAQLKLILVPVSNPRNPQDS